MENQASGKGLPKPKGAETITIGTCADRFKSILFSDSDSTLKSIVSSKQVERRYIRSDVHILKQFIEEKLIDKIVWIGDNHQIADILTKDKSDKIGLDEMMRDGRLRVVRNRTNYIYHDGRNYKMHDKLSGTKLLSK